MAERVNKKTKARWLKQLHQWHWISSALCLISMVLFSVTGITLNHAADIDAQPVISEREAVLPPPLLETLAQTERGPLPETVRRWLAREAEIQVDRRDAQWSADEVYLARRAPAGPPGGPAPGTGALIPDDTDRGWVAFFNDLHKGRHSGAVWFWFIDLFAVATLLFALTGLALMALHAKRRPATWPVTALGLIVPWLLLALFVH